MSLYKQPKRKFHDAWAFILFIIATLLANSIYISAPKENTAVKFIFNYRLAMFSSIYFISCCFISNILLLTIPFYLMHVSFIALPIIFVALAFMTNDPVSILISLFFGVLSLVSYFFVRKHIKYSAVICKAAARIVNQYIITVPLISISFFLIVGQIVFAAMNLKTNNYLFYLVCLLQMYWTYFAIMYFVRVFVASIVSLHVFDKTGNIEESVSNRQRNSNVSSGNASRTYDYSNMNNYNSTANVTMLSIKNTLFSLGPICFGSLLVAIVSVLEHLQGESRNRERGTGAAILYVIVGFLLALLREFIEFANSWAYIYIALYGTNYVNGIKGAYELIIKRNNKILVNDLCIMSVLNLLSIMCMLIYYTGAYFFVDNFQKMLYNLIFFSACGGIFLTGYLSTFDSAGKAFLFAYDSNKEKVAKCYPKEHEALEEQLKKHGF